MEKLPDPPPRVSTSDLLNHLDFLRLRKVELNKEIDKVVNDLVETKREIIRRTGE